MLTADKNILSTLFHLQKPMTFITLLSWLQIKLYCMLKGKLLNVCLIDLLMNTIWNPIGSKYGN